MSLKLFEDKTNEILEQIKAKGIESLTESQKYFLDNIDEIYQNQSKLPKSSIEVPDKTESNGTEDFAQMDYELLFKYNRLSPETGKPLDYFFMSLVLTHEGLEEDSENILIRSFIGKVVLNDKGLVIDLDFNLSYETDDPELIGRGETDRLIPGNFKPIQLCYPIDVLVAIKAFFEHELNEMENN